MSRPGRRPGSPDTQGQILDAARRVFGEVGYDRATVRQIASEAGVDPGMIYHYFGNKEQLFASSIDLPVTPAALSSIVETDEVGRQLARLFFTVWETESARAALLGVLRSAIAGEEQAVVAFRQFLTEQLQRNLVSVIDAPDAELRALAMASHLVGVAMTRYVMRLEPIASAPIDEIIDLVAPRIQSYLEP